MSIFVSQFIFLRNNLSVIWTSKLFVLNIQFRSIFRHSLRHSPDISYRSHLESGRLPTAWIGQHANQTHFLFKVSANLVLPIDGVKYMQKLPFIDLQCSVTRSVVTLRPQLTRYDLIAFFTTYHQSIDNVMNVARELKDPWPTMIASLVKVGKLKIPVDMLGQAGKHSCPQTVCMSINCEVDISEYLSSYLS